MVDIGFKRCSICQKIKPLTSFYVHWQTSDGRWKMCPDCHRETVRRGQAEARKKLKAPETKDKQEPFVFHDSCWIELTAVIREFPGSRINDLYNRVYEVRTNRKPRYVYKYLQEGIRRGYYREEDGAYFVSCEFVPLPFESFVQMQVANDKRMMHDLERRELRHRVASGKASEFEILLASLGDN